MGPAVGEWVFGVLPCILDQLVLGWQRRVSSHAPVEIPEVRVPESDGQVPAQREGYPSWRALTWFALFRIFLALALDLIFIPATAPFWRFAVPLPAATTVALVYSLLVLLGALATYLRWPSKEHQVQIAVFVDILVFTLLMHSAGGVASGLGLLLAIAVAAGALLMEGRLSLLFASLAALGVLLQQTYAQLYTGDAQGSLTTAGLLGLTFFAVALLGHVLYRRIQETEQLAERRQVDIADLSKLNEFIIQSMGTGVVVVDGDRNLRLLNSAARHLLSIPQASAGASLAKVAPELEAWLDRNAPLLVPRDDSLPLHDREIRLSLKLLGEYRRSGALVFLRDQRELVRAAQQIKLASLGRLTASIAHNIRNPLSAVGHAGQLLAESPNLAAEDLHLLDIIRRNIDRIDDIIESVLSLSRRDRGTPERLIPAVWLADFCADFRESRDLPPDLLHLSVHPDTPAVSADPRHLHQVLSNLCDNALRHATRADARLRLEVRARPDPDGGAVVEVADNGPGISPEVAREIFTPFFTTSASGTGLGLYIARELCEINGAELEQVTPPGPGACFRLSFSGV
jgi:two-component system sensor histidine kinase PilS (NtrC family)